MARINYNPNDRFDLDITDMTYRADERGKALPARIYRPKRTGPLPALLDVHGGAWSSGDHTTNAPIAQRLAQSGIMVFSIACRTAPDHPYPSQAADVNHATRWLKAHAEELNITSGCIGGLGVSSGGHSLFLSAMRPHHAGYNTLPLSGGKETDARLSWLIGAWPVLDPRARYRFAQKKGIGFLVDRTKWYFRDQGAIKEGNPQLALERGEVLDLPPALMIEGTADENLPKAAAERFTRAYCDAGGKAQLELFPGMSHGFALKPGPESDRAVDIMKAFIKRQLG